jgi:hypothetical protein
MTGILRMAATHETVLRVSCPIHVVTSLGFGRNGQVAKENR